MSEPLVFDGTCGTCCFGHADAPVHCRVMARMMTQAQVWRQEAVVRSSESCHCPDHRHAALCAQSPHHAILMQLAEACYKAACAEDNDGFWLAYNPVPQIIREMLAEGWTPNEQEAHDDTD